MDTKNVIAAISLSAAVIILYSLFWAPNPQELKEANENKRTRPNKEVEFKKFEDPELTYVTINGLFKKACHEWQGVFEDNENIKLRKDHLQVCIGPVEPVLLMGSNLRIMDDAFEYLLPTEAKKKKEEEKRRKLKLANLIKTVLPALIRDPDTGALRYAAQRCMHLLLIPVPSCLRTQSVRKCRSCHVLYIFFAG